ncbi:hypothetical protein P3W45_001354 [Vairimorpha bombi]|jgi:hypothetical protein
MNILYLITLFINVVICIDHKKRLSVLKSQQEVKIPKQRESNESFFEILSKQALWEIPLQELVIPTAIYVTIIVLGVLGLAICSKTLYFGVCSIGRKIAGL